MIDLKEIVALSLKSILKNKSRTALTMLGIIIGVSSVILLVSLGQGLQKYITGQFEELGSNIIVVLPGKVSVESGFSQGPPNFAGSKLTLKQTEGLAKLGGPIEDAAAAQELPVSVKYLGKSKYTTIDGITANYGKMRNIQVATGRGITEADVALGRKVAILGKGLSDSLFGASDPLGKEITIGDEKFQVIGILAKIGAGGIGIDINNFLAVPITASQRLINTTSVMVINIKARDKESIPQAITMAKNYLAKDLKEDDFTVLDQTNLLTTINQILGVLTAALGGIAAISLVVGGVGIMNIMLVSVTERTREIGLRKAVGAKPSDILFQFIIEAIVLSSLGGLIGILIGAFGAYIINKFFPASVTLWSIFLAFGVSGAVGVIFGVAPAVRASKLDPIDALRYE